MSQHPCKVLARQIESLKRYQTGLRELIAQLSDLAAKRSSILVVSGFLRNLGNLTLATAGALAGGGALLGKALIGKSVGALGGMAGLGSAAAGNYLDDDDLPKVQRMIEEATREFMKAHRKKRQLRREYKELQCDLTFGKSP